MGQSIDSGIDRKREVIEEPAKHVFDFQKCLVVIISISPSELNIAEQDFTDIFLPEDLADLSDFIEMLESRQFNVPPKKIIKFINPEKSEDIKDELAKQLFTEDIENVLVFYQGFGYKDLAKSDLHLLLSDTFKDDPSTYLTMNDFTDLFEVYQDINLIFFLDCSFSALAFNYLQKDNCVIIASSGKDEYAYFANDAKRKSIFSSSFVQILKKGIENGSGFISLSDLFLQLRFDVIKQMRTISDGKILQIPRMSSRNLTQYYQFIRNNSYAKPNQSSRGQSSTVGYEEVRELLEKGNIKKALEKLKSLRSVMDSDDNKELTMHIASFNNVERAKRINQIGFEEYNKAGSKMLGVLLDFIELEQVRKILT